MPFNRRCTTPQAFLDHRGKQTGTVNMMFQRGPFSHTAIADLEVRALELPLGNEDRLSMVVLMPNELINVTTVFNRLSTFGVARIMAELRRADKRRPTGTEVFVCLPRFSFTTDFTLNVLLEPMGGIYDFAQLNLSNMLTLGRHSARVIHKTRISVTDTDTHDDQIYTNRFTAPRFHVNRPFAFFIIEKTTNSLLFAGQVIVPDKADSNQTVPDRECAKHTLFAHIS